MTRTLTLVSHTHWDREWYQPFQEYRMRLVQLVDRLLDLLEQDQDYRYFTLDGQTILMEDYLEIRPEREEELKHLVKTGRLLIGPWYILPDEFLVSPEATIRNLLLGDSVARQFGSKMEIGYVPDSFGHISQLPQILRGFGMDTAVIWRGVGDWPNEFRWVAPDGTEVLVIHLRDGYGNAAHLPTEPQAFAAQLNQIADDLEPSAATPHLLAMNGTDHLEPMPQLSGLIAVASDQLTDLLVCHGTLPQHVAAVRDAQTTLTQRSGELRSPERAHLLPGVFSTRMWIKQRNAYCEVLLEKWVEPFSTFVDLRRLETPTRELHGLTRKAWRYLIQNHPHDSICGCSVDAVHKEMDVRFDWVEQIGEEVTRQSLHALANAVDTTQLTGTPVVVFSPTAGPRSDLVSAQVRLSSVAEAIDVMDADGRSMPSETMRLAPYESLVMHLDRREMRQTWAEANQGILGEEGIQSVEISSAGDTALIDVTTAPYPPAIDVLERASTEVKTLLDRQEIHRFEVRIHHWHTAEVRFLARDLPGHGYKTFVIRPVPLTASPSSPAEIGRIQNEFFEIAADPDNGSLTVTDKKTGMVLTGLNQFVDGGDRGDEYNYCQPENDRLVSAPTEPPVLRLVGNSAVRQTLEIIQIYHVPTSLTDVRTARSNQLIALPISTHISLSPGLPRIDFVTTVENCATNHRLRVHFPAPIATNVSHAEGHFDVLTRTLDLPRNTQDWPEQPVPTLHQRTFVDVSDGKIGLLVASKGLPEYEVVPGANGVTVALTLLRCTGWLSRDDLHCRRGHAGPGLPTPGAQCLGTHVFEYALIPHSGGWENAYAQAHAFNAPLRAVAPPSSGGPLPLELSFVRSSPPGFVLTAIKRAEEGDGLIVRGFNSTDATCEVTLEANLLWSKVTEVALDESLLRNLGKEGDSVRFVARPKQIVTLRFAL
jgi:alpha-mannosidase